MGPIFCCCRIVATLNAKYLEHWIDLPFNRDLRPRPNCGNQEHEALENK